MKFKTFWLSISSRVLCIIGSTLYPTRHQRSSFNSSLEASKILEMMLGLEADRNVSEESFIKEKQREAEFGESITVCTYSQSGYELS